jgi:hypothetical protein
MKKFLPVILLSFIVSAINAQEGGRPPSGAPVTDKPGEKKGWPSSERYNFIRECINTAKKNLREDAARFYCYCMQEWIESKYPTIEEAGTITEDDMNSPTFQKKVKECQVGTWTAESRNEFLTECKNSAKEMGEEKARSYCECMLFKVEKAYPNAADTNKLTEDVLATPVWKKRIEACVDF